jgi:hypothetical protein
MSVPATAPCSRPYGPAPGEAVGFERHAGGPGVREGDLSEEEPRCLGGDRLCIRSSTSRAGSREMVLARRELNRWAKRDEAAAS